MNLIPVDLFPDVSPDLNVADLDWVEGASGPGLRLTVWLQGCLKRCPGCANIPFLSERRARRTTCASLLDLLSKQGLARGVTLSGGEPVLQARALIPFLMEVRELGLDVMCYSGYRLEELTEQGQPKEIGEFLSLVDLLVDGQYRRELARGGIYRPSRNQRLQFLSGRILAKDLEGQPETAVDIRQGTAALTGTLPTDVQRRLFEGLRAAGIRFDRGR